MIDIVRHGQTNGTVSCASRGFAAPLDVLADIGLLDSKIQEDWRRGRPPYQEAVCTAKLAVSHHRVASFDDDIVLPASIRVRLHDQKWRKNNDEN